MIFTHSFIYFHICNLLLHANDIYSSLKCSTGCVHGTSAVMWILWQQHTGSTKPHRMWWTTEDVDPGYITSRSGEMVLVQVQKAQNTFKPRILCPFIQAGWALSKVLNLVTDCSGNNIIMDVDRKHFVSTGIVMEFIILSSSHSEGLSTMRVQ